MSVTNLQEGAPLPKADAAGPTASGKEWMGRATETLKTSARRYAETAQRQADALRGRTLKVIRERPGASVGSTAAVALVAGVLIGYLLANAFSGED
jgi:ElaB/YqjD/DUF883 family membrane-anchored ribosome-binding protein